MKPRGLALLVVLLLPLALLPSLHFSARDYVLQVLTEMFVFMVLAQSYDIMGGTLGYINLGHIVFFGLGAYAFGIAFNHGVAMPACLAISLASGMAFALLISYPFFRLRGAYFALATFGLVKLMENVTNNLEPLTGGSSGLKILAANRTVPVYYTSLILVAGALAVAWLVSRSRLGLAMKSIREDEAVARDFGVPTTKVKAQALVLSAAFP
ncbi:MAG TPA: branched-chain amino acid ABC transporter permease, partial [bacterium]|nr:branched-chain amino acid ABC transporter permease [bacterium]